MGTEHEHTIVVGFDGSKGAAAALAWAVREAEIRGDKLCIVQAWTAGEFGTDAEIEAYTQTKLDTSVREALNGTTSAARSADSVTPMSSAPMVGLSRTASK